MEKKNIICTCCPMGCHMTVIMDGGKITNVTGNTCKRGENYAHDEVLCPKRTLTTTVKTDKGIMLSVKSENAIPREIITDAMRVLSQTTAKTPVSIGDTVYCDICGTDINIVATKNLA